MALRRLQTAMTALAALGLLAGCGQRPAPAANATNSVTAGEADYKAPPELTGASIRAGVIELDGQASPGSTVRLANPDGAAEFTRADADGGWRIATRTGGAARLFSLSTSDAGRVVQAVGYLFVTPDGTVARLRAGGGSEPIVAGGPGVSVLTLDYDNQRAVTLTGHGEAGTSFSLRVDGVERSQASVDAAGRFELPLSQPLAAGPHDFDLVGGTAELRFTAPIDAPVALGAAPFAAARIGSGWRVDWVTPGGGEQTTLILPVRPG